jgi:hypothetical protein
VRAVPGIREELCRVIYPKALSPCHHQLPDLFGVACPPMGIAVFIRIDLGSEQSTQVNSIIASHGFIWIWQASFDLADQQT